MNLEANFVVEKEVEKKKVKGRGRGSGSGRNRYTRRVSQVVRGRRGHQATSANKTAGSGSNSRPFKPLKR